MEAERIISSDQQPADRQDNALRPEHLDTFIGQEALKDNLAVFLQAAKKREDALDHVLLHGPPGLGKTTLAQIIARELGVNFRASTGPLLTKPGDLAAILSNLQARDVLFIDEIHRLPPAVEELLYSAMEDYQLDLVIGEGPAARTIRIDLQPFTLVGATTRSGLLTTPLRDRFGIPLRFEFYSKQALTTIITANSKKLNCDLNTELASLIAARSRGTPRVAGRLLRRVRDFIEVCPTDITAVTIGGMLTQLGVDDLGLDGMDRRYLKLIADHYAGGPVGIDTLAAALSEQRDTLEDVVEPYLLQIGFLQRTPRGRMLGMHAWQHLGLAPPVNTANQMPLA